MIEDGELCGRRGSVKRPFRQTPNKLIQTGAQVVKRIANGKANSIGNVEKFALKTIPSLFKILIAPNSISFRSGELFEQQIESVQMHLRPTKLQVGIGQSGHSYHRSNDRCLNAHD